ncbi:DNA alkylation repair protein [Methanobrevibacter filiformis]|uniref:DNA alkylation repair enzyme n=1 Tax=Methanobrevibacter filiformis TaxID=55758 RepID=A0A162FEL8_9EURY|nr:DNA alkylation repair protein [Methanobrevibacter filiformis]KZX11905.1 DNA alkylation repair enzyme [Methanobrevibacter filiformis]
MTLNKLNLDFTQFENSHEIDKIIKTFEKLADPEQVDGMARFGINPKNTYAIRMPVIKKIAKDYKNNHSLALDLWKIDTRETRILASLVDVPKEVTSNQMDNWAEEFDYWEICDQCCINLFRKTEFAYEKIQTWSESEKEFVKRAAFALIATLAVHDKNQKDEAFIELLDLVEKHSNDNRKLVKKAVNWALRQIGKKNMKLNEIAIEKAKEIDKIDSKAAHWIAKDALRELQNQKIIDRIISKDNKLNK